MLINHLTLDLLVLFYYKILQNRRLLVDLLIKIMNNIIVQSKRP
jgi:hypothetical protein